MINGMFLNLDKTININIDELNHSYELSIDNPVVFKYILENIQVNFEEESIDVFVSNQLILSINYHGERLRMYPITAFEVKMICAHQPNPILIRENKYPYCSTDLHTHFTAIPRGKTLINLGLKYNIEYPTEYLKEIGIDSEGVGEFTPLSSLNEKQLEQLRFALSIKANSITIFNVLEKIYKYREPFTKNILLFEDLLDEIAKDYAKSKVRYVEISQSLFYENSEFLKIATRCLPKIEEKYHVDIRFLCAVRRNDVIDRSLDRIDIIRSLAESKYIVGIDFLGHETNSTSEFKTVLKECFLLSMNLDKYFVVRIHAGETPVHINNINTALKYADSIYQKEKTGKRPLIRIGHGLFGVNETTMKLAKLNNAIIEFNISSNLSLNNIRSLRDIPIKRCIDNSVNVVIGTDGPGIYRTNSRTEMLLAANAGLEFKDIKTIKRLEDHIIDESTAYQKDCDVEELYSSIKYHTKDGKQRYVKKTNKSKNKFLERQIKKVENKLLKYGVSNDTSSLKHKCPILITGSSRLQWPKMKVTAKERVKSVVEMFVSAMNPDKYYLVTGGTSYGVEELFQNAAYQERQKGRNVEVLGVLVAEAETSEIKKNAITKYEYMLNKEGYETDWYGLANDLISFIKQRDGIVIAISGGNIVNDIIQMSYNQEVSIFLMKSVGGASSKKSEFLSHTNSSFKNITELQRIITKVKKDLFEDPKYTLVDIHEYIKTLGEPFEAYKVGYIKVRKAINGEVVETYTSGILETKYIAKKGEYIATQLDKENKPFVDQNGKINQWIISNKTLNSKYLAIGKDIYQPKQMKYTFVKVDKNICFKTNKGKMLLLKGGYLDISNPNGIYGIQKTDFDRTYIKI